MALDQCTCELVGRVLKSVPLRRRSVERGDKCGFHLVGPAGDRLSYYGYSKRRLLTGAGKQTSPPRPGLKFHVNIAEVVLADTVKRINRVNEKELNSRPHHFLDVAVDGRSQELIAGVETPVNRWSPNIECNLKVADGNRIAPALPCQVVSNIEHLGIGRLGCLAHG